MAATPTTRLPTSTNKMFTNLNTVTTKYYDLDISKVQVTQFEDKDFSPAQKLAGITHVPSTGESLVQIQCCESQLFSGGIPNSHPKFYPTDDKRMYVVIPEDLRNPTSVAMFTKLDALDAYMQTPEVKTKLFGKLTVAEQFVYQPIVRTPEVEEEEDEDGNPVPKQVDPTKGPKPRSIKVKIGVDFKTKKITSKIFVKGEDGKRTPVPQEEINTIDDVKKYVRFMSTITPIIVAQKVYQQKKKKDLTDTKKYGVTFKLHQVICTPATRGSSRNPDRDDFVDDDTNTHQLSSVQIVAVPQGTSTVTVAMNDVSGLDEGVEEEYDEEETDVPVQVAPAEQATPPVVVPVVQSPPPVVGATKPRGKRTAAN